MSFNFMAAITTCSDFGAQKNKVSHCFHCFPMYLPWSDGTGCHVKSYCLGRTATCKRIPYKKINSKWIKDLNVRSETIKLLEENIGPTLDDINLSKILYDPPPRVMELKTEVNKWGLIKLKCFCTVKETISKVKRQSQEWKKIIANETTDKD